MTFPVRVAVQIQPADTPDYATWRHAVLDAEAIGADVIFGYDHFHAPFIESIVDAKPILAEVQPTVNNFEGWTARADDPWRRCGLVREGLHHLRFRLRNGQISGRPVR